MFQRTIGQIDPHRADVNRRNMTRTGRRMGRRTDGFSKASPASSLSSSQLTMPQLANFQLGDRAAKPLTYNSSFGLPGSIDRRQSAVSVASSGSDLLDSFHSDGSKKRAQALFKETPRANISLPCGDLSQSNAAEPSASQTSPTSPSAETKVMAVNEVAALNNPKMNTKADNTKASKTVRDSKTSRDAAVERLSIIVKGDRQSIKNCLRES